MISFFIKCAWHVFWVMFDFIEKHDNRFENKFLKHLGQNNNAYYSTRHYVKNFDREIVSGGDTDTKDGEFAIVLRGLPRNEEGFTLHTINIYKKIFPKATIIYSLWSDTPQELIKEIEAAGCIIQLTEPLKNGGVSNINNQVVSQLNGVKKAKECGVEYVFCQRADARCLYRYALEYLKGLIEVFPIADKFSEKQKQRIVVMGCYTNRVQELPPYYLRDYAFFGTPDDLIELFDIPLTDLRKEDYENYKRKAGKDFFTVAEEAEWGLAPEGHIITEYIKKITDSNNLIMSYEQWWELYRNIFISISPWDIDFYWDKYDVKYMQPTGYVEANNKIYETRNYDFRKFILILTRHLKEPIHPFTTEDEFQRKWIGW